MIIDLHKYLFVGAKEEMDLFFERAQKEGIVQFLSSSAEKRSSLLPASVQNLLLVHKILRTLPVKEPYAGPYDRKSAQQICARILDLKKEIDKFTDEKSHLEAELVRVAPLGDFSMEDLRYIEKEGRRSLQFFCVKSQKAHQYDSDRELVFIGTDYDLDYFFSIQKEPRSYPGMIELHVDRPASLIKSHISFIQDSLHELEAELKGFAGHILFLRKLLLEELDNYHLHAAKKEADIPSHLALFSVEGWVPSNHVSRLEELIGPLAIYHEQTLVDKNDVVPTYMENSGFSQIGEDLVHIYDTPSTEDKDPSPWILWFFALFFAIIVADGGYGVLYLALALWVKKKLPEMKGQILRFYRLLLILSSSCIIWGVLTASFFGIKIAPSSVVSKASIFHYLAEKKMDYHLDRKDEFYVDAVKSYPQIAQAKSAKDILLTAVDTRGDTVTYALYEKAKGNIFLEFTLFIGVVHLCLSLMRVVKRHWANIGWICCLVGGYLYVPIFLQATSFLYVLHIITPEFAAKVGLELIFFGVASAIFLSLLQKGWKGIGEITNGVQLFGDTLSYLRLYALGLASTIMAETMNSLGPSVGAFFGVIVILIGHGINITLGIMAGVIHGLRLNFIEWYHHSYSGGGRKFNPLKKLVQID